MGRNNKRNQVKNKPEDKEEGNTHGNKTPRDQTSGKSGVNGKAVIEGNSKKTDDENLNSPAAKRQLIDETEMKRRELEKLNELIMAKEKEIQALKAMEVDSNNNAQVVVPVDAAYQDKQQTKEKANSVSKLKDTAFIDGNEEDVLFLHPERDDFVDESSPSPKTKKRSPKRTTTKRKADSGIESHPVVLKLVRELEKVKEQLHDKSAGKGNSNLVKSPSDTAIYAPAVRKQIDMQSMSTNKKLELEKQVVTNQQTRNQFENELNELLIQTRIGQDDRRSAGDNQRVKRRLDFNDEVGSDPQPTCSSQMEKQKSRERILQAEKFRAQVEAPKGMYNFGNYNPIVDDDEFMHVTCHLDEASVETVEQLKYIELEKLTAKSHDELGNHDEDGKVELYKDKGGNMAFRNVAQRGAKITNVHAWEKSFRIYMAIYTRVRPDKASEMVQYIHTIHHAASKYTWDNVAHYDKTFRRLMAKYPERSWAKTYSQMWNIALCDHLSLRGNNGAQGFNSNHGQNPSNKKDRGICYRFNKGHCPFGTRCRFIHRCMYCGGNSHGASTCFKKNRKSENKNKPSEGKPKNKTETNDNSTNHE